MNKPQGKLFLIVVVIVAIIVIFVLTKQTKAPIVEDLNKTNIKQDFSDIYIPENTPQNEIPNEPVKIIPPVVIPTIPPTPKVQNPITIGDVTMLPLSIIEDSRCPQGAMCIWAGRFILKTKITKGSTSVEANLELGQEEKVLGSNITLTEAEPSPDMRNQNKTSFGDYKFTFEVK